MSEKSERLFQAMSDIGADKIDEAAEPHIPKKTFHWKRWTALAAALALVVGVGSYLLPRMGGGAANGGASGSGTDGASTFMSYAGPVFPLTLKEENAAVTAERNITLDFQPWVRVWRSNEEEAASLQELTEAERQEVLKDYNEWYPEGGYWRSSSDILVTDSYVLTNGADVDQRLTVLYPFVSSLGELSKDTPVLTANGGKLETVLHAGGYSGDFQGAWENYQETGENPGTLNLDQLNSWEEYKALLLDGTYQAKALGDYPDLTGVPVVVYKFTDALGPEADESKGIPNPSIRVTFNMDYHKTAVLSYGFHSMSRDEENHFMGQGFSIREEQNRRYDEPYYLIVLGEDVQNLEYRGYATGGWDTQKTVEAGVTVQRYETDLDTVLREVAQIMYRDYRGERETGGGVDFEMYYGLLCEYLTSYGLLSEQPAQRYDTGWLWDNDVAGVDRVFYLEAEVTVPAGQSVKLTAEMTKEPSYDFCCAHTENQGLCGYDLVTRLGSNLACTAQTATLEDRGQIGIVRQNFGFDLGSGIKTVTLDPDREHYYLEIRRLEESE